MPESKKSYAVLLKVSVIVTVIIVSIFTLWFFFRTEHEPEPIPRNIRILIIGPTLVGIRGTLFEVSGTSFEIIKFGSFWPYIIYPQGLCFEDFVPFDVSLVDDFIDSFNLSRLHVNDPVFPLHLSRKSTTELSQEQLEDVWRRIDSVVRNYEEPTEPMRGTTGGLPPIVATVEGPTIIRAIIDDEYYWSVFERGEYPHIGDFRIPRRDRRNYASVEVHLVRLAHELIDLSPIRTDWAREPFPTE